MIMKPIKTKADLLEYMASLRACQEATDDVHSHVSDSAWEIWQACVRVDWLIWLGGRRNPRVVARFARMCADRAKSFANAANAAYAAANAVHAAAYAVHAADAADGNYAECQWQLETLRKMW